MAKKPKLPKKPANRDLESELSMLGEMSLKNSDAMRGASVETNQAFIDQALAVTDTIAGKLNNEYTAAGRLQLDRAMGQIPQMDRAAGRLSALGDVAAGDIGGTAIEAELTRQAEDDLALGRMLSAEEERAATQSARGAFAARGQAVGKTSAIAEILNRQSAGDARQAGRRAYAGEVNQLTSGNRIARLGQAGSLIGQEAGVRANTATLGMTGAQGYIAIDPYERALQSNIPTAFAGPSANLTSSGFGQTLGYMGDLQGTNFNADWSDYINKINLGLAGNGPKPPSGMFARMMAGASAGGQVGGIYGAAGGAFDGAVNGPIYKEYSKQTGAPK
ncbi:MAG: hypothetical protein ACOYM3_07210 [Terrimicrobiaceae bacterium]